MTMSMYCRAPRHCSAPLPLACSGASPPRRSRFRPRPPARVHGERLLPHGQRGARCGGRVALTRIPTPTTVLTTAGMQAERAPSSGPGLLPRPSDGVPELTRHRGSRWRLRTAATRRSTRCSRRAVRVAVPIGQRDVTGYMRPWRLRTKLYAPKDAIPRAATTSRTLPNGACPSVLTAASNPAAFEGSACRIATITVRPRRRAPCPWPRSR